MTNQELLKLQESTEHPYMFTKLIKSENSMKSLPNRSMIKPDFSMQQRL